LEEASPLAPSTATAPELGLLLLMPMPPRPARIPLALGVLPAPGRCRAAEARRHWRWQRWPAGRCHRKTELPRQRLRCCRLRCKVAKQLALMAA